MVVVIVLVLLMVLGSICSLSRLSFTRVASIILVFLYWLRTRKVPSLTSPISNRAFTYCRYRISTILLELLLLKVVNEASLLKTYLCIVLKTLFCSYLKY